MLDRLEPNVRRFPNEEDNIINTFLLYELNGDNDNREFVLFIENDNDITERGQNDTYDGLLNNFFNLMGFEYYLEFVIPDNLPQICPAPQPAPAATPPSPLARN